MLNFLLVKERALANIFFLLDYWKIDYIRITDEEIDFKNPRRDDRNYGACRFNIKTGLGADFADTSFGEVDYKRLGMGFSREDFNSNDNVGYVSAGFDIIGFTQRLYGCPDYKSAAELLDRQLEYLAKRFDLVSVSKIDIVKRINERDDKRVKQQGIMDKVWNLCRPVKKTIGETYLNSRMIFLENEISAMKFAPKIMNKELSQYLPALVFKITKTPQESLKGIHRIYLTPEKLNNKKMAVGEIKGNGIWFGLTKTYTNTLSIAEGPENALSVIKIFGIEFCVSTINSTNFHQIEIPEYITDIKLFPDGDPTGKTAAEKAFNTYSKTHKVTCHFPPVKENNPKWDWNDELRSRGNDVGRNGEHK